MLISARGVLVRRVFGLRRRLLRIRWRRGACRRWDRFGVGPTGRRWIRGSGVDCGGGRAWGKPRLAFNGLNGERQQQIPPACGGQASRTPPAFAKATAGERDDNKEKKQNKDGGLKASAT
jgi:hypothetical protein